MTFANPIVAAVPVPVNAGVRPPTMAHDRFRAVAMHLLRRWRRGGTPVTVGGAGNRRACPAP